MKENKLNQRIKELEDENKKLNPSKGCYSKDIDFCQKKIAKNKLEIKGLKEGAKLKEEEILEKIKVILNENIVMDRFAWGQGYYKACEELKKDITKELIKQIKEDKT